MQAILKFLFGTLAAFIACNLAYYGFILFMTFTAPGPFGERLSGWWLSIQALVISTAAVAAFGASRQASLKNGIWFGSGIWVAFWIIAAIGDGLGL